MKTTLKYPRFKQRFLKRTRYRRLSRLVLGLQRGYYTRFKLPEKYSDLLREVKSELREAQEREIIDADTADEALATIDQAFSEGQIDEEAGEHLLNAYKEVYSFYRSKTSGMLNEFDKQFKDDNLEEQIVEEIQQSQNRSTKEIVQDYVVDKAEGDPIAEIFHELWVKWGEGFSYSNIWGVIDELDEEGVLDTETATGKRRVYPILQDEQINQLRAGKENILKGQIENNITDYFRTKKAVTVNIHEFHRTGDHRINTPGASNKVYVAAKDNLPLQQELTSIGLFYPGSLRETMRNRFGYELKQRHQELVDSDAQIAWVVKRGNETHYQAPENDRAKVLAG